MNKNQQSNARIHSSGSQGNLQISENKVLKTESSLGFNPSTGKLYRKFPIKKYDFYTNLLSTPSSTAASENQNMMIQTSESMDNSEIQKWFNKLKVNRVKKSDNTIRLITAQSGLQSKLLENDFLKPRSPDFSSNSFKTQINFSDTHQRFFDNEATKNLKLTLKARMQVNDKRNYLHGDVSALSKVSDLTDFMNSMTDFRRSTEQKEQTKSFAKLQSINIMPLKQPSFSPLYQRLKRGGEDSTKSTKFLNGVGDKFSFAQIEPDGSSSSLSQYDLKTKLKMQIAQQYSEKKKPAPYNFFSDSTAHPINNNNQFLDQQQKLQYQQQQTQLVTPQNNFLNKTQFQPYKDDSTALIA